MSFQRRAQTVRARVSVLLATYNGGQFLNEQFRSIDSQTLPIARITVRDDGSTDDTLLQIEKWAHGRPGVSFWRGTRLGAIDNFFTLLKRADEDCEYFAFCDQDDVWLPDKVERAVGAIRRQEHNEPAMYCSRVEYVDKDLRHLGYSKIPKEPSFANALVENIATGCTLVLNRKAREIICSQLPQKALLHDWWCYLVVSAFGKVIYDDRPSIKYRQHAANVTGGTSSLAEIFKRRFVRFLRHPPNAKFLSDQAAEFHRYFGDVLPPEQKRILERFLTVRGNLWRRLSYNLTMDVWRQTSIDTAILRTLILIGRV